MRNEFFLRKLADGRLDGVHSSFFTDKPMPQTQAELDQAVKNIIDQQNRVLADMGLPPRQTAQRTTVNPDVKAYMDRMKQRENQVAKQQEEQKRNNPWIITNNF